MADLVAGNMDDVQDEIAARIEQVIKVQGWHIFGIVGEKIPYMYTVGLAEKGKPELFLAGTLGEAQAAVINELAKMVVAGKASEYETVEVGGQKFLLIPTSDVVPRDFTIQAGRRVEDRPYSVLQVLFPDPEGKFPGDPACVEPWASVPLFPPKRTLN